ncbi:hypothetical protein [Nocardia sp. NPDC024068]|uniref:hypothetical protein n=1 Tax=Nocardia sp. NPDC024068 TaxID=3157197 RepID=UPI0033FD2A9A
MSNPPEDGRTRIIEGLLNCDGGFIAAPECLGATFDTLVGGREVTFEAPGLVSETILNSDPPEQLLFIAEPRWRSFNAAELDERRPWDYFDHRGRVHDKYNSWGTVTVSKIGADGTTTAESVLIRRFRYYAEVRGGPDDLQIAVRGIGEEIMGWWSLLRAWLEITTTQDLSRTPLSIFDPHAVFFEKMWTAASDGSVEIIPFDEGRFEVNYPYPARAVDNNLLRWCAEQAANGQRPPLEWQLIRDARRSLQHNELRRSVIDAGTAAELALTRLLDRSLHQLPESVVDALLSKYQMLGQKTQLYRKFGGTLPSNFQQLLIEPRNRAAHTGAEPSHADAEQALTAATEIVTQASPLPRQRGADEGYRRLPSHADLNDHPGPAGPGGDLEPSAG